MTVSEEMAKLTELKRQVDDQLGKIEAQIYDLEESYFDDTPHGNLHDRCARAPRSPPPVSPPRGVLIRARCSLAQLGELPRRQTLRAVAGAAQPGPPATNRRQGARAPLLPCLPTPPLL